jgi:hypothetical protein
MQDKNKNTRNDFSTALEWLDRYPPGGSKYRLAIFHLKNKGKYTPGEDIILAKLIDNLCLM